MGCGTSKPPAQRNTRKQSQSTSSGSSVSISSDKDHERNKPSANGTQENARSNEDNTLNEEKNVEPQDHKNTEDKVEEEVSRANLALVKVTENDESKEHENRTLGETNDAPQLQEDRTEEEDSKPTLKSIKVADDDENEQNKENGNEAEEAKNINDEGEGKTDVVTNDEENKRVEDSESNYELTENKPEVEHDSEIVAEDKNIEIPDKPVGTAGEIAEENVIETRSAMGGTEEDIDDGYDDNYTPFDDEDEDNNLVIDGYEQCETGLMVKSADFRKENVDEEGELRPVVGPGELYTDKDFPLEIAIVRDTNGVEWKRPHEFLSAPKLFYDEATRFDIGQGSAGTCWFLSSVSVIAEKDDLINQIIPSDAYNVENSEAYDGVFHARFFRFGRWEDIYIDDYIPIIHGERPWGARSSTNENEVWVCLLEKAFARLHGSYDAVYGGQPGDAYLQLTGGIGERIELDEQGDSKNAFYKRISNALNSGSQITCVVPDEFDDYKGLVGGHAYSLVATAEIQGTKLVRVRNPWGYGEWKGPWSDESDEWPLIESSSEKVPQKDDGEFYVSLNDFMKHFSQTTICSLTPDFDCDGKSDPMNFILNIFGEWTNDKMGGFREVLNNPRFAFTITKEGILADGTVPFVIQMVQHIEKRKTGNASMRCDVFKIKGDKLRAMGRTIAAEIQGKKNNVYTTELQSSFRHRLKPGRYMAIPSTCDGGVKKAFLLRIYTPAPLMNVKEVTNDTSILSCENEESLIHGTQTYNLICDKTLFGAFVSGVNAGGQVSNRDTYSTNPQYLISIPDTGTEVPLIVHIMQAQVEPQYPVGFRIFSLDRGCNPPVNVEYLYDKYNDSPDDIEGNKSKFMISWDVDVRYMLPAGRYVALVHMDQPDTEKTFAIVFKSDTNIGIKGYQTGE